MSAELIAEAREYLRPKVTRQVFPTACSLIERLADALEHGPVVGRMVVDVTGLDSVRALADLAERYHQALVQLTDARGTAQAREIARAALDGAP